MGEKIRILLVEDNPGDVRLLLETIREGGDSFAVDTCGALEPALRAAEDVSPDVILLDLNLPDSHGLYTFLRMRQSLPAIPVVVLTGLDDEQLGLEAVKEGAEDFLTKGDLSPRILGRAIRYAIERHELKEKLEYLATHDALTGVYNRRYFTQMIDVELARSTRYKHSIGFLMIDIDGFKETNDLHGHQVGDTVLKAVADFLTAQLRTIDLVIRYGGDEFLLVLPETGKDAELAAERIREASEVALRDANPALDKPVHLSVGAAYWDPERSLSLEQTLAEADRRMYEEKNAAP